MSSGAHSQGAVSSSRIRHATGRHVERVEALFEIASALDEPARALDDPKQIVAHALRRRFSSRVQVDDFESEPHWEAALDFAGVLLERRKKALEGEAADGHAVDGEQQAGVTEGLLQERFTALVAACDGNYSEAQHLADRFNRLILRPRRSDVLRDAMIVSAMSAFEQLIASTLTALYERYPGSISKTEASFTLAEIQQAASIDEVVQMTIRRKVDSDMRGSLGDWYKAIRSRTGLDLAADLNDWDGLREVNMRRNLIVHAGGRVSREYRDLPGVAEEVRTGHHLQADLAYVQSALDTVLVAGVLTAALVSQKICESDEHGPFDDQLRAITFDLMADDRWRPVYAMASHLRESAATESDRLVFQVNAWQAQGRIEGWESIADEVSAWDTSALTPIFAVARLALLQEHEAALASLKMLIDEGQLPLRDVETWPLFEGVRGVPDWRVTLCEDS